MIPRIRSLLARPWAYQLFFNAIGAPERSRILVRDYIRPRPGNRILEIGCGPGTIVPFLPESEYVGFDVSAEYISQARKKFSGDSSPRKNLPHAKFVCERVSEYSLPQRNYFDIVLALGIVHHLADSEALQLFRIAHDALKPDGKLVTLDGVWTDHQSGAARYLLSRDRGQFVRSQEKYVALAAQVFSKIKPSIRHDLLRIPYTHLIMECLR
jgi:SAM-dependent methyltransferase